MVLLSLPWELWKIIIRLATTADPEYIDPVTTPNPPESIYVHYTYLKITREYDTLTRNKANITRVSRQWREMAIPFLFEDVRVKHHAALQSLVRALKRSSSRTIERSTRNEDRTPRSYGYYTLRFALSLYELDRRPSRVDPQTERKLDQQNFIQVLVQCENLQTVRVTSFIPDPPLHPTALHRLKIIRSLALDTGSQPILFSGPENLESLTISSTHLESYHRINTEFVSFPRLHNLRLWLLDPLIPDWIGRCELPSLKSVTLEIGVDDSVWGSIINRFFAAHGERIRSLDVSPSAGNILLNFLSQTPCLEHLTLYHTLLNGLAAEAHPITVGNLVRLDIRTSLNDRVIPAPPGPIATCMKLLMLIFQPQPRLRIIFHSLEEIRMVDMANEEIRNMDWIGRSTGLWNMWVVECKGVGLRIMDCTGAALEFE